MVSHEWVGVATIVAIKHVNNDQRSPPVLKPLFI